ncbi:hypothetical protein B2J93_1034 [Marssonina coronariae]|uniref:Uncharacterized protein n=1 Tax=Diplocarpon coronariae TaxID=2795749 RepID=A0A218Z4W1_9HELO|nr:hypothetical protein B2J93_1034 [Marssonina coronariae]
MSKGDPPPDPPPGLAEDFGLELEEIAVAVPWFEETFEVCCDGGTVDRVEVVAFVEMEVAISEKVDEGTVGSGVLRGIEVVGFVDIDVAIADEVNEGTVGGGMTRLDVVKKIRELLRSGGRMVVVVGRPGAPGYVAGMLMTEAGGGPRIELEVDDIAGHSASIIPPFMTIPSSVCALTLALAQMSCTAFCIDSRLAVQAFEHPLLKSTIVHPTICVSYVRRHNTGSEPVEICWKFERENASVVGSAKYNAR